MSAPMHTPVTWKSLADKAVAILNRHIVPDGISDKDALSELYGIFDGPDYRAAISIDSKAGGACQVIRIRTYTNPFKRATLWLWDACDRHQWLPLAIVIVLLLIVNSIDQPF